MNCNVFISHYHSYSVTQDGKVYSKYEGKYLQPKIRDGYNEVLFSLGTGKERITQWFRVDWLVAMRYISNTENYSFIHHKDGNTLNDNVSNLEWRKFCVDKEAKEIDGYRGKYIVTSDGKVYNNYTGEIMKQRLIHGYPHVGLRVFDGNTSTQKLFKVHRLVAEYFIPNPNNLPVVNHINGNREDARASNLEWVSYSDNNNHAISTGLKKTQWNRELGRVAITLIEDYKWSSSEVAELLGKTKGSVLYLYQQGYKNLGLSVSNIFVKKTSKYDKSLPIPDNYKQYITELLKGNTVLNTENKSSVQCNDQTLNLSNN